ncbi:MAG: ATP-binding protein [Spirochaetales bacterium]|nr:ATP-binding protein [Spirochaetales bacterium]
MNFIKSIKTKLIILTVGTFIFQLFAITIVSRLQLKHIVDVSQITIYEEKISIIIKDLDKAEDRLNKTGLREIYVDDFQEALLKELRTTYYDSENIELYPFITDKDLAMILHPLLPQGDTSLQAIEAFQSLKQVKEGELYSSYGGSNLWYVYRYYPSWEWYIIYSIPLEHKYAHMREFIGILLLTMVILSLLFIPSLIWLSNNLTAPIIKLTKITTQIARGDLDQTIPEGGDDEVGTLSQSVALMQNSIKEKIESLNREMAEKTKMEEQLVQARKMDAIGKLAGGVAHDFNNMLAGISSATQLLTLDESLSEENRHFVEMILETTDRAAELTAKLLAFGRKKQISSSRIDLHMAIRDSLNLLGRTLNKKITINLQDKARESVFIGDFSAIQNSIMNLAINSAHAMPRGGTLSIETENKKLDRDFCLYSPFDIKPGLYIKLMVSDTGTGIDPKIMDKIFEPFFTSKELGKGTGLGLSMVYATIQEHKGAIELFSEVGKGTSFHIYLPCSLKE